MLSLRCFFVSLLSIPALYSLAWADAPKELDARLRVLEKEIAAVRGLAFKTPVQAKIIARPGNDAKTVQGYYSIKDKTLFLKPEILDGTYIIPPQPNLRVWTDDFNNLLQALK